MPEGTPHRSDLLDRLRSGEVLVGDGAWGTLLMARGLRPGEPPDAMNLTRPDAIEEIARQYLEAGADLITTNTFGGSPARLRRHGLEEQMESINRAGVKAVRRAMDQSHVEGARRDAGFRAYVSASVGPSGHMLAPHGDGDPAAIRGGFERQIGVLAAAGADLICIETMTDLAEAILAVRAARDAAPGLPVMATMTFEEARRGFFTVMGVSVEQAARGLSDAGANILGSNCGNGSKLMLEIAREFRRHTTFPLAIQPNAGMPESVGSAVTYPESPEFMAEQAKELLAAGVGIIGGCCGTTPEHVRALRRVVGS